MKKITNLSNIIVSSKSNIRDAVKQMDKGGLGIVFIVDKNKKLEGILTDGDFRRAVLKGISLNENICKVCNKNFIYIDENEDERKIINIFLSNKINRLPVVSNGILIDVVLRENYNLENKIVLPEKSIDVPVVIMAGGKGTRMKPFTNVFPKPLLPIGDKTMLEVIMEEYGKFGFSKFYLTVNYKANLIETYFNETKHDFEIIYVKEPKFMGTAGALKLLNIKGKQNIFVSNCDILIYEDYLKILDFHNKGNFALTLVAAVVHHQVPYGVCKIKNGGELDYLSEKPEFDYLINSGMYIIDSEYLKLIPDNEFFHITDLMEKIKQTGSKIGVFPVSEKSWIDVGEWEKYNNTLRVFFND